MLLAALLPCPAEATTGNLLTNGGFELGLTGWRPLWCRQSGAGNVSVVQQGARTGTNAARIEHRGGEDWSFEPAALKHELPKATVARVW